MVTSRQNLIKDIVGIVVLTGFVAVSFALVIPHMQRKYIGYTHDSYYNDQLRVVRKAVENKESQIVTLEKMLRAEGIPDGRARGILMATVRESRFGIGDYGYYYIFDDDFKIVMHPIQESLVGKNLRAVTAPDGAIIGEIVGKAVAKGNSGCAEYRWAVPGTGAVRTKKVFIERIPELKWYLVSGFYLEDMDIFSEPYVRLSRETVRNMARSIGLALALSVLILTALMIAMYIRIRKVERGLSRQMSILEQYKLILDESSLVSKTDVRGIILYVNDKFCATTGYRREEVLGRSHNIERHPETPLLVFKEMWDAISGGKAWSGILKNRKADGTGYFKHATIVPVKNEDGEIIEYLSSGQDITELVEKRGELEKAFSTDPLTGLGNRMRLLKDIEMTGDPTVALVNIRNFSALNQTLGAGTGDDILRHTASVVFEYARDHGSSAYRVYADTFALLCPLRHPEGAHGCEDEIIARLGTIQYDIGGDVTILSTYIGFASQGKDSFAYADMALARAKESNSSLYVFNAEDTDFSTDAVRNMRILRMIHDAIRNGRIIPSFQPIMELKTGRITKYECLIRMKDPEGNIHYPDEFVGVAKKSDLYPKLTLRMIEKSMEFFETMSCDFSINFTIEDIMNDETIAYLLTESRYRNLSSRLIVEIVETEELKDFGRAVSVLGRLRDEGIRIAIDDFGSGYSSFEYVLKLNPSFIKIDRVITQNILTDPRAYEIMKSVVGFAQRSGISTVAEFVDSEQLREEVAKLGIDFIQGWLVGPPVFKIG